MPLSVGQTVIVRPDLQIGHQVVAYVTSEMVELAGKVVTIREAEKLDSGEYAYLITNEVADHLWWDDSMFLIEPRNDEEAFDLLLNGTWNESQYQKYLENKG